MPSFDIDHIENEYDYFTIRKNGKRRAIQAPKPALKEYQSEIQRNLASMWLFHPACSAIKGRGIAKNAEPHYGSTGVLVMDIKHCFQSTTRAMVEDAISWPRMQACGMTYRAHSQINSYLIPLMGVVFIPGLMGLPTGAPTSPILCNMVLTLQDHRACSAVGTNYKLGYSRYLDDIVFSGVGETLIEPLSTWQRIELDAYGYQLNQRKTRYLVKGKDPVVVTGVDLTSEHRTPRAFRRMLRAKIQNLAEQQLPLDAETLGCLAYIQSIDVQTHAEMLNYYQRRLAYVKTQQPCLGS
jgi:hypothetical protein